MDIIFLNWDSYVNIINKLNEIQNEINFKIDDVNFLLLNIANIVFMIFLVVLLFNILNILIKIVKIK